MRIKAVLLFATAVAALGQFGPEKSATDRSDVVQRMALSEIVAVGTVVDAHLFQGISVPDLYKKMGGAIQLEDDTYHKPVRTEMKIDDFVLQTPPSEHPERSQPPPPPAGYLEKLARESAALLNVATTLSEAVSPENRFQKIDRLRMLSSSTDEMIRKNAAEALRIIDGGQ